MSIRISIRMLVVVVLYAATRVGAQPRTDAAAIEAETLQHFQALLRLDTSSPPGNQRG